MHNVWKTATLGLLALSAIVGTSTLTTAYLLRPPVTQPEEAPASVAPAPPVRAAVVRVAPVAKKAASPAPRADCAGTDRAARIAKPGALGAVLGAGLGAAGGGIANGGRGAGQGALIGGLAGAALGAGYGAYQTKAECGAVFGEGAR